MPLSPPPIHAPSDDDIGHGESIFDEIVVLGQMGVQHWVAEPKDQKPFHVYVDGRAFLRLVTECLD